MSAGHGHSRPNHRHHTETEELLAAGDAPQLMHRFAELDDQHDVPYLAGYNVAGTKRFIDVDVLKALLEPEYAKEVIGAELDTGLSPEDTVECLALHEGIEKVLLDADNDIDTYMGAHEMATSAEHEEVRRRGGSVMRYERGLAPAIAFCAKKPLTKVDPDFDCTPLLDRPDRGDKKIIAALQKLGIADASKAAKDSVDYGKSTGGDQCAGCAHWQDAPEANLSNGADPQVGPGQGDLGRCEIVCGLVRRDRWCKRFEAKETSDGEGHGVQSGDGRGGQEPEDQESSRGGGSVEPGREPGGEEGQPEPGEGEVSGAEDPAGATGFAHFGTAAQSPAPAKAGG